MLFTCVFLSFFLSLGGISGGSIPSRNDATTIAQNAEKLHQWLQGTTSASSIAAIQSAFHGYHSMAVPVFAAYVV